MPTHLIEGEDYKAGSGALSGERIFGDADPATAFRQYEANALYHGLRDIVKAFQISGDLTAASGATDQTEGYVKLGKALARMARRFRAAEIGSVALDAVSATFSVDPSKFVYIITEAPTYGPYVDGKIYPDPTSPAANNGRVILMINASDYSKMVGHNASGKLAQLQPGESCFLYGQDLGGVTTWIPIGKDVSQERTVSVKAYDSGATGTTSSAVDMIVIPHSSQRRIQTINIPQMTITMASAGIVEIAPAAAYADFGDDILSIGGNTVSNDAPVFPIMGTVNSTNALFYARFVNGTLLVQRVTGGNFSIADVVVVPAFSMTYVRL
jgi:hypothetical protein